MGRMVDAVIDRENETMECPRCKGYGDIIHGGGAGQNDWLETCPDCVGTGEIVPHKYTKLEVKPC